MKTTSHLLCGWLFFALKGLKQNRQTAHSSPDRRHCFQPASLLPPLAIAINKSNEVLEIRATEKPPIYPIRKSQHPADYE